MILFYDLRLRDECNFNDFLLMKNCHDWPILVLVKVSYFLGKHFKKIFSCILIIWKWYKIPSVVFPSFYLRLTYSMKIFVTLKIKKKISCKNKVAACGNHIKKLCTCGFILRIHGFGSYRDHKSGLKKESIHGLTKHIRIWFVSWITKPDLKRFVSNHVSWIQPIFKRFNLFSWIQQILTNL